MTIESLFQKLSCSPFRRRFHLRENDRTYITDKGIDTIRQHAQEFIRYRLAPAHIPNDGRQTPMSGHPVFIAQHACGCCCRGCLSKWHNIPVGIPLSDCQQNEIVDILMIWIEREMKHPNPSTKQKKQPCPNPQKTLFDVPDTNN